MLRFSPVVVSLLVGFVCSFDTRAGAADWEASFKTPPPETKPWVYWYWASDNISKEGITHDLEAMARAGIAEALIGNVDVNRKNRGKVKALTPEWWSMVVHAMKEGARVGVRVGFFNSPGWSQSGGPWIKPEHAMRYLTASETRVKGPVQFTGTLPAPAANFQQVAVLAYPAPTGDTDAITKYSPKIGSNAGGAAKAFDGDMKTEFMAPKGGDNSFQIDLEVFKPFTARSLILYPAAHLFKATCELQVQEANGGFRSIKKFEVDRHNPQPDLGPMHYGPVAVSFPDTTGTHFRLIFSKLDRDVGFTEIELTSGARLERYVEKQLGKMFQEPLPSWDTYMWPTQAEPDDKSTVIPLDQIKDLTKLVDAQGRLKWTAPEGEWIIERIGMAPTGSVNGPATPEATGLEVDKMSRAYVRDHFDAYAGKMLKMIPPIPPAKAGHIVADSYEKGSQNWTDGLETVFQKRYGYDPIPWLPVLTGRLVGSADQSERFLWDLRRLVADRIATEYVGGLRDVLHEHSRQLWLENYGHWGFPAEFLSYGANSDDVGGEFWTSGNLGSIELRAASSAAHTSGKPTVSAESFTSGGPAWKLDPWALKSRGEWSWTEGVNHAVLHVFIHQAYDDKAPGVNANFGTEINRLNTWFPMINGWIDSFRRAHGVLQHGLPVADVAYFIGEDTPKMTGTRQPELPSGYNYDYINAETIERFLTVKDGRFWLPNGISYRLLVLPPQTTMRPELLRKIEQLVAEGGAVFGPAPSQSPSMQNFPKADDEIRALAGKLWAGLKGKTDGEADYGKGKVFVGSALQPALDMLGVKPQIAGLPDGVLWTHRDDAEGDAYFLTNQSDDPLTFALTFRVDGKQPEWWDYVTGTLRPLPEFMTAGGLTTVPLQMTPRGAGFVVFRKPAPAEKIEGKNFPEAQKWQAVEGPWSVKFANKAADSFNLIDWTKSHDPAVQHFSGIANYTKSVTLPAVPAGKKIYLDLGKVNGVASVRLNGKDLGIMWANPRRADVTAIVRPGTNTIEVALANTWANALIGQASLPKERRKTWTLIDTIGANSPLEESGLVGPVSFLTL